MNTLTRLEQEAAALLSSFAEVWRQYGSAPFPVDLRSLVMIHLQIGLEPQTDPRDARDRRVVGGLVLSGGTPRIIYRMQASAAGRERFTIAHEVGHYMLHRDGEPDYFCTEQDMEQRDSDGQTHRVREWEANLFAGALLMPRDELLARYSAWQGDPDRLTDYFGVSREALYWRMVLVGLAPTWSPPQATQFRPVGVRVLQFGDAHIGAEKVGRWGQQVRQQRRSDFIDALRKTVQASLEHDVDVVLFTGDAFQDRAPTNEDQKELARALWPVIARQKHLVLVVGNHDRPASGGGTHSLWTYGELAAWLELENVHVAESPTLFHLQAPNGLLDLAVLPFVPPSVIAERSPELSPHDATVHWADKELARMAAQRRRGVPSLLAGHLTVVGAAVGEESHLMASAARDLCLPSALLTRDGWDYIGLGHIHRAQQAGPVVYAGSLERVDFGEEGQPKGYVLADLVANKTTWSFVPLQGTREFRTVDVNVTSASEPTETILEALGRVDVKDAIVRLRITLYRTQVKQVHTRRINQAMQAAGALGWDRPAFDFAEVPTPRTTEVAAVAASIDPSRPMDALRAYLRLRTDVKGELPALIALAEEIETHPALEARLAKRMRKGG